MRQLFWSIAYRANFPADIVVMSHRSAGHGPKSAAGGADGTLLIDAMREHDMPPLALPAERYMTRVEETWEELQLPSLFLQSPWHGYTLGDWDDLWTAFADKATAGAWEDNGEQTWPRRKGGMKPETPVRNIEGK